MRIIFVVNPSNTSRQYGWYRDDVLVLTIEFCRTHDRVYATQTTASGQATPFPTDLTSFDGTVAAAIEAAKAGGIIQTKADIDAVAVKVVAPGEYFATHRPIDELYTAKLDAIAAHVPKHIPDTLDEIDEVYEECKGIPVVAISDSAFHTTIPATARASSLPEGTWQRYGYKGIAAASIQSPLQARCGGVPARAVVVHIDETVSVTSLRNGESVATSMGYTPASGVMMLQSGGDIEADAFAAYLIESNQTPEEGLALLTTGSGVSTFIGDVDWSQLHDRVRQGDAAATEAHANFLYHLRRECAAQIAMLGGVDAVVLAGSALLRSDVLRQALLADYDLFNIALSAERNVMMIGKEGNIAADESVPVYVLQADELGEMARLGRAVASA